MTQDQPSWAERVAAATQHSSPRQIGAIPVIYPIVQDLGLRETVDRLCPGRTKINRGQIAEVLALNRLMAPQPLYHVQRWAAQTILPDLLQVPARQLYDQYLGRSLDALQPVLDEAWMSLVARAIHREGIDMSVLHYDTTSFYFEGEYDQSDLARYGYSADGKTNCKRAKVGYTVTHWEGLPCLYALLAGNIGDDSLPVSNLESVARFLKRPDVAQGQIHPLIISDGKMITPALVVAAHDNDMFYLGPWEANSQVDSVLRSVSRTELAAHELAYRPKRQANDPDFTPYQAVWRAFPVSYQERTLVDRGLVVWSQGKQRLDEDKRKQHLKALLNRLSEIKSYLNTGKYIQASYASQQIAFAQRGNPAKAWVDIELSGADRDLRLHFAVNRDKLAEAQALDGRYLLGTNQPDLAAEQALTYFKGQDKIEKRNAVFKGPLLVRPVYLKTDRRIAGLVFFTMVAMLVWAIVELRCQRASLPYTAERILDEFTPLYVTDQVFTDNSRLRQIGDVSDFQQTVLSSLQLAPVEHYLAVASPKG
jgi:transposase